MGDSLNNLCVQYYTERLARQYCVCVSNEELSTFLKSLLSILYRFCIDEKISFLDAFCRELIG